MTTDAVDVLNARDLILGMQLNGSVMLFESERVRRATFLAIIFSSSIEPAQKAIN